MFSQVILFIGAIVVMAFSAYMLVGAIDKMYKHFGLTSLAAGLLFFGMVLAFPVLLFSQMAVQKLEYDSALGLIIGVMSGNLFLTYGLSGLFGRIQIIRKEILFQFLAQFCSILFLGPILFLGYYHVASALVLIAFFIFFLFKLPILEKKIEKKSLPLTPGIWLKLLFGMGILNGTAIIFIEKINEVGKVSEMSPFGYSAVVLGCIAITPQLLVALIVVMTKRNTDLITGSMIGTNIFNSCFVLGTLCFYNFDLKRDFLTEWFALLFGALSLILLVKIKRNFYKISGAIFLSIYFSLIFFWSAYSS